MKLGYVLGIYDVLRANDLKELDKEIQIAKEEGNTHFALGIYEEELAKIQSGNTPLKSLEDRMKIAEQLRGIDFVFSVPSLDNKIVRNEALKALQQYAEKEKNKPKEKKEKKYKIAYAPGTFDLFHAGHLENLLIAASQSEFLVAGVKSDELVINTKKRHPILSEEERSEILRHFKFVADTYIYYTEKHLPNACKMIKAKHGEEPGAVFMGSDLAKAVSGYNGINIVFTDRNPELMKKRSTTYYRSVYLGDNYKGPYKSKEFTDKLREEKNLGKDEHHEKEDGEER